MVRPVRCHVLTVVLAIMLSFCRFGAAFGLAILTIVRQSVQSTEERRIRGNSAHVLAWPEQQAAMFKGLQAAFWMTAAYIFIGEPAGIFRDLLYPNVFEDPDERNSAALIVGFGMEGWEAVGKVKTVEQAEKSQVIPSLAVEGTRVVQEVEASKREEPV